jgi:hypothetical protein
VTPNLYYDKAFAPSEHVEADMGTSAFFKEVKSNPERFYLIHYSSESLYDEGLARQGLSPRITSIVVMHLSTRQIITFATHTIAEELGIRKEDVEKRSDHIEGVILEQFYAFARGRREKYWVHWNMRDSVFGFEHLEHRYRVLTRKEPPQIPVEVRVNLNDLLRERYGDDFAPGPRMLNLMLQNGQRDARFLVGAEEAEAFKTKDFIRMHSSTISKVEFFRHAIVLAGRGKLRTAGRSLPVRVDRLLESRSARLAAFGVMVASLLGNVVGVVAWVAKAF